MFTHVLCAERRLIDLRIEHANLDALIDSAALLQPVDELHFKRLKKQRLSLRDQIVQLAYSLRPAEPA